MMHHSRMRHTLLGRLLLTGVAAAFGLIYVPSATIGLSVMRSGESVEPVSLYVDGSSFSESPMPSVAPSMGTDLGNHGPAVHHEATFQHQPASGHHHNMSGQPTGKNPERRQALAALAALMIQIQSAGTGGR